MMTAAAKQKPKLVEQLKPSGLGLAGRTKLASLLDDSEDAPAGGPIQIPLDRIRPDPNQPRKEFNPETLQELAESIKLRGVKTPISVQMDPDREGYYVINHGERRWRASSLAGKDTIPGFIDGEYSEEDQVIENLQRDNLTPREMADWIGRQLSRGKKQREIAKAISKTESYVSQYVRLLDLPDPINKLFQAGLNDVVMIGELVKAYKKDPEQTMQFLEAPGQELTRGAVKTLHSFLAGNDTPQPPAGQQSGSDEASTPERVDPDATSGSKNDPAGSESTGKASEQNGKGSPSDSAKGASKQPQDPEVIKKAIVQVEHDGRPARLMLTRRAPTGLAWLKYDDDGHEFETRLTEVTLVALVEGT